MLCVSPEHLTYQLMTLSCDGLEGCYMFLDVTFGKAFVLHFVAVSVYAVKRSALFSVLMFLL